MAIIGKTQLENYLVGSRIAGSGGGGNPEELENVLNNQKKIELIKAKEVSGYTASVGRLGAAGQFENIDWFEPILLAFTTLIKELDIDIAALVPLEIGPGQLARCVNVASEVRIPIVDGDYAGGRSVPTLSLLYPSICGKPISPVAYTIIDIKGQNKSFFLDGVINSEQLEKKLRALATRNGVGFSFFLFNSSDMEKLICQNSISYYQRFGKIFQEEGIEQLINHVNGKILASGMVRDLKKEKQTSFNEGSFIVDGVKVSFVNEYIAAMEKGKLIEAAPRIIGVISEERAMGLMSNEIIEGEEVIVISFNPPSEIRDDVFNAWKIFLDNVL